MRKKVDTIQSPRHIKLTAPQKKAAKLFTVWNKGTAGVREMAEALEDDQIMFGLLQIKVGKGTFMRTKNLFLHFNALKFPSAVKRSKINEKYLSASKLLFGHVHAELTMEQKIDCTVREVFTRTKGCFIEDDLGTMKKKGWSIEKMEQEYDKKMRAKLNKVKKAEGTYDTTDPTEWKGKRLVRELHEEHSPINWALFRPHKKLLKPMAFGMGDLSKLRECLQDDMVQYALIRMSFGSGTFRRSHWIFFALVWRENAWNQEDDTTRGAQLLAKIYGGEAGAMGDGSHLQRQDGRLARGNDFARSQVSCC